VAKTAAPTSPALLAQWADLPDYAQLLEGGLKFKVPPRLVSGEPPAAPDFPLSVPTAYVQVLVAINERGDVVAARVCRSDDARLDAAAVAAVESWKFTPAEDAIGPVKTLVQVPLQFDGPPPEEQNAIAVNLGPFAYDARRREISAPILLTGPAAADVKAARTYVERAVDDTGAELAPESGLFNFPLPFASSAKRTQNALPPVSVSLRPPAAGATKLRELNGTLEMVIPSLDPNAMVQVDQLPAKLGQPVSSSALAAAGITIIVMDQKGSARALTDPNDASGARDFLTKEAGKSLTVWKNPANISRMNSRDVALAIHDPHGRLAGVEFQTMYGTALAYNRNGWSHYSIGAGKRFSIYRLNEKLNDEIKLVCWLVTPKSLASYPIHVANVPLPAIAGQ
jgi:TonB family protein